jgi:hypothetical protein
MQIMRSIAFCVVLAAGCAVFFSSSVGTSVDSDFLVRTVDGPDAALKRSEVKTLNDWEYTSRRRPAVCRFF